MSRVIFTGMVSLLICITINAQENGWREIFVEKTYPKTPHFGQQAYNQIKCKPVTAYEIEIPNDLNQSAEVGQRKVEFKYPFKRVDVDCSPRRACVITNKEEFFRYCKTLTTIDFSEKVLIGISVAVYEKAPEVYYDFIENIETRIIKVIVNYTSYCLPSVGKRPNETIGAWFTISKPSTEYKIEFEITENCI